ncbi:autotransporter domain-containing protein [Parvibaculaceae bacterium PLY_AMNH_Bact1]|nr:autotransporter domain-containing protein [Parvibaculaceae bacterium PLY_AMNH_Bact1]
MQKKMAQKLIFCGIGVAALVASTTAQASPGCDAANAGNFNRTTPANTNLFTQTGGPFDIGDTLFATVTGTPLSAAIDLLPGPDAILFLNNANGSGSHTLTVGGPRTIDIALAGGPGGQASLTFTCTPVGGGPGGGQGPGPSSSGPGPTEQSDTATNSTTTSVVVENGVVNGLVDGAAQEDPTPTGPTQAQLDERNALEDESYDLAGQNITLEKDIAKAEKVAEELENRAKRISREAGDDYEYEYGHQIADLLLPMDIYTIMEDFDEDLDDASAARIKANARRLRQEIERMKAELKANETRQGEIQDRLKELPTDPNDFTPVDPEELGDGESILFASRDPFARALMRYRGFHLDVADTGEGFNDTVKPLSFTRTLSSTIVGWVRAVYTDYEQDDASRQEGDNILVALGAHKDINDELRVGLFATSTWGDVTSPVNNLDIDTTGYSLGAYGRYKWGEIDVNASTRIGLTDNDIAVSGTTGSYDTRLASITLGISGEEQLSDDVWMRPAISVTNTWVNREDYVNSAGTPIGGNTTWTGNVSAGPTIGTSLAPPSGFKRLEPAIGLQATYNYSDQDTQSGTVTTSETDYLSLSVSPQLSMEFENGASVDVFGSYFGIGADLDGWSVGGTLSIPLN